MNFRPWPEALALIPQVNPNAWSQPEMVFNFNTINELIREFNNDRDKNPKEKPRRDRQPKRPATTGGTTVLPYDGVSPAHDVVPYVITNGVLKAWPAASFVVGSGGTARMTVVIATGWLTMTGGFIGPKLRPAVDGTAAVIVESTGGSAVMTFDTTNRICYPNRMVLPVWMG